jgi:hypothetical protein
MDREMPDARSRRIAASIRPCLPPDPVWRCRTRSVSLVDVPGLIVIPLPPASGNANGAALAIPLIRPYSNAR